MSKIFAPHRATITFYQGNNVKIFQKTLDSFEAAYLYSLEVSANNSLYSNDIDPIVDIQPIHQA